MTKLKYYIYQISVGELSEEFLYSVTRSFRTISRTEWTQKNEAKIVNYLYIIVNDFSIWEITTCTMKKLLWSNLKEQWKYSWPNRAKTLMQKIGCEPFHRDLWTRLIHPIDLERRKVEGRRYERSRDKRSKYISQMQGIKWSSWTS